MHVVDVEIEVGDPPELSWLEADARSLLDSVASGPAELSVLVVDDARVMELNRDWRDKPEPTDVLSFPQQEGSPTEGVLGDIVISLDTAARQASEHGHDLPTELRVLLVHGLCHLMGHDHHDPDAARAMSEAEGALLAVVGASVGLVQRATI